MGRVSSRYYTATLIHYARFEMPLHPRDPHLGSSVSLSVGGAQSTSSSAGSHILGPYNRQRLHAVRLLERALA